MRKTYDVLQTRIKQSNAPRLDWMLAPKVKEERHGRWIDAIDMLFGKLMTLQTQDSPDAFLKVLEQHHSNLVKALRDVHKRLKDNIFADINFQVEDESQVPSGKKNEKLPIIYYIHETNCYRTLYIF